MQSVLSSAALDTRISTLLRSSGSRWRGRNESGRKNKEERTTAKGDSLDVRTIFTHRRPVSKESTLRNNETFLLSGTCRSDSLNASNHEDVLTTDTRFQRDFSFNSGTLFTLIYPHQKKKNARSFPMHIMVFPFTLFSEFHS